MPGRLHRYQKTGRSHFVTFGCYRRRKGFASASRWVLFLVCLEEMRQRFEMRVYGYVVMPEHVHLLVSEPENGMLADAIHYLKLSFTKRMTRPKFRKFGGLGAPGSPFSWANLGSANLGSGPFWQKRYY